jgi:hypothetical protein
MTKINNPFNKSENLSPIFERNISYQDAKLTARNRFTKYIKQVYPNLIKQSNFNLNPFNFMTPIFRAFRAHSISFMIGLLVALSIVGASAAQAFAPDNFKPSNVIQDLFKINKQQDKDPYTSLKPDANNDVVKSDGCDLAIKYPKQINNIKVDSFELDSNSNFDRSTQGISLYLFGRKTISSLAEWL